MSTNRADFRVVIEADLAAVENALVQAGVSAGTVALDQSSIGRLSRMDALQQQAMAQDMVARLATRKRRLDAALARVEAGTFGRCCECDGEIAPERLLSEPAVVFCSDCMADRDAH